MARMPSMVSRAEFDPLRLPGGEREGESVEDQLIRCQREFVTGEVVDAARDLDLAFRRPCHALLIDGQGDDARAMVAHRRQHRVAADASVLQVDAVDDAASRVDLERCPDDVGVGAVDDQRRIDAHLQRLDDGAHLIRLVAALGDRDAQVERMRATFDLRPRDLQDAVIVVREEQTLDGARPLGIDPLADEQRRRLLTQVDRVHAACQPRFRRPATPAPASPRVRASPARECAPESTRNSRRRRSPHTRSRSSRARWPWAPACRG